MEEETPEINLCQKTSLQEFLSKTHRKFRRETIKLLNFVF